MNEEELSDLDNKRIIENYKKGVPYSLDFIRSLHFDSAKKECLDYNEQIKLLNYYTKTVEEFDNYIKTISQWY